MTKPTGKYCGMFYNNANCEKYVGDIWKLANGQFVIRSVSYGNVIWESAPFASRCFRKVGGLNLGYAKEVHYTAA